MEKSIQYSFINNKNGFSLSIIKGKAIVDEIMSIHNIGPNAKDFYNKTILSSLQMINFVKPTETLGFYIDSESPYYRFKIEMSSEGTIRTLLLPEEFSDFPKTFTGNCRVHKSSTGKAPYTSMLSFEELELDQIINQVLEKSYQTKSVILMGKKYESSIMVTLLPPTKIDQKFDELDPLTLPGIKKEFCSTLELLLSENLGQEDLEKHLDPELFTFIGSKEINFNCPCSKERMIENLFTLGEEDRIHIFEENNPIEVRCDYCNTTYLIKEEEVNIPLQ